MTCKLCGTAAPLIKAHIIPKPFFTEDGHASAKKFLSDTPGVFPKRIRVGFYDDGLLCAACDRRIGIWDQYAVELFLHGLDSFSPFPVDGPTIAFTRPEFDSGRLKLFVLSLLWRSGISSHENFRRVKLGPYEPRLREMILADDAGGPNDYCTVLSAFTLKGQLKKGGIPLLDPHRERWHGANAYRLSLGVVTAYVKVDRLSFPESFVRMALKPNEPLYLIEREYTTSPEFDAARKIARAPHNSRAFPKK